MALRNWSENILFSSAPIHEPQTVEQLQEIVRASRKVRVLGARHSFNDAAAIDAQVDVDGTQEVNEDTSAAYISLEKLEAPLEFDSERGTVTCNAGITYGELCTRLNAEGMALHNTASLPHISVAGACSTATHGSGDGNGNLATAVVGLEMVTADGELKSLTLEKDREEFEGSVVSLGGLGVVTRMTLSTEPAYLMQQYVYEDLPSAELYQNFDEIMSKAYSVSLFPDWQGGVVNQVWFKHRTGLVNGRNGQDPAQLEPVDLALPSELYGARAATTHVHPVPDFSADGLTLQMGMPGPWHDRLHHFQIDSTPASGDELQTEYFVPRAHAVPALQAVEGLRDRFSSTLWISEIRSVAADRLWLSQSYATPTIGIHFSWRKNWPAVREVMPLVEEALAPFEVRPHWGKLFSIPPRQVQAAYPKMEDFRDLLRSSDPDGKFRNGYLDRFVFG
ncbi:MAG: FAD-binding protein [Caldilineaceae bacterium SB0664_bin_27]|uniref:FAD-binding protein n=1 Tax=Caldilineaceae bacterium SB0664_bin_27 TaxID=2605260 RepID=A0A6B0YMC2_9CHLR|nr:FAD-binding protein [Caldilineaceae bacterium SB0664_bin_27]